MTDLATILSRLDANPNAMYSARKVAQMLREATLPQSNVIEVSRGDFHDIGLAKVVNVKAIDVTTAGDQMRAAMGVPIRLLGRAQDENDD